MTSLIDLPRELLQQIILHALQPPFHLPTSPGSIKPDQWVIASRGTSSRRRMSYHRKKPIYSLSLTCRRMRMETADVWTREGNKLGCEIDAMVTENSELLVTWLMYPKSLLDMCDGGWRLGHVSIKLRFFEGQVESDYSSASPGQLLHTLVRSITSLGPVPPGPPATRYTKRGRRALEEAAKRPPRKSNANVRDTLSIRFSSAAILKPGPDSVSHLGMVVQWLLGPDLYHTIPWGQFEGGVFEGRSDVPGHRGRGFRRLEFWSQNLLVLEYDFQCYETVTRTWVTTKAYALPSTTMPS